MVWLKTLLLTLGAFIVGGAAVFLALYLDNGPLKQVFGTETRSEAESPASQHHASSPPAPLSEDELPPVEQFNNIPKTKLYDDHVAVLMYHDMSSTEKGGDIITPDLFAAQLDFLRSKGMNFITLEQFRSFMEGAPIPENAVLVTFDDGYENFYTTAYPIMKERGISGVSFVITGDFSKKAMVYTPHMTRQEIQSMLAADPNTEVQPHTNHLHYKTSETTDALTAPLVTDGVTESPGTYLARISGDLASCIDQLKSLNKRPVDTFAYPYGLYTPEVQEVVKDAGIKYAFTTTLGLASRNDDPYAIPRINGGSPLVSPQRLFASIYWENKQPGHNLYLPDAVQHSGREDIRSVGVHHK
ncbi:polysaccharide deacetylase family protein [Paenibacillus hunanensis]|uniref:polysaccharide deacetylase family protein n=1 Tax=Paenibacillus hunanensis TaxID=539262 RepID=UPI002A6A82FA|nr:polysaccharide deacetylase family protein [Paenibacillus hunanensis]WPP40099.1 polysaccharide deacetylase family protein [Paenibacillus hunanensis]